jgi:hypothetical protein
VDKVVSKHMMKSAKVFPFHDLPLALFQEVKSFFPMVNMGGNPGKKKKKLVMSHD